MDARDIYKSYGLSPPPTAWERGLRPKFVKFAPGDRGDYLADVFFDDPRTFQPKPGPLGQIHCWGLFPYEYPADQRDEEPLPKDAENWPAYDGLQAVLRQTNSQMTYLGDVERPEAQFLKVLVDRKKKQLRSLNLNDLCKSDVICKITLAGLYDRAGNPRIWRRFKVSAGISIQALQDKVVAPLIGWVRNLHCYHFTDFRDGSLFGPEDSSSIDIAHIAQVGYDYLPDDKYKLAHLFSKEGDEIGYLYDFGDKWYHTIQIEKIIPVEQSTGAVEVMDGKGMCPGENMKGSLKYVDFLDYYDVANPAQKAIMRRKILECPNYKSFGTPRAAINFNPVNFDLEEAAKRVTDALNSANSVRSGAKQFVMPTIRHEPGAFDKPWMKKPASIIVKNDGGSSGYWQETHSKTKDKLRVAVCAMCGRPASADVQLKTCSGCRRVMYCSSAHQKDHWKPVHKKDCTRELLSK